MNLFRQKAYPWTPRRAFFPALAQRKLNGIRAVYDPDTQQFQSNDGHKFHPDTVAHILNDLLKSSLHKLPLDGEFYCHGMSLQEINSRMAVNRTTPHPKAHEIQYHIFDLISDAQQQLRLDVFMNRKGLESKYVRFVDYVECEDEEHMRRLHSVWTGEGYEGVILRHPSAPYGFLSRCSNKENRWMHLLKFKTMKDIVLPCVGVEEGEGKYKGSTGALLFNLDGCYFTAGSGLTDYQRNLFWNDPNEVLGKPCRINYEMLSDNGTPLKPIIDCVDYQE